jgi:hypothetical protein
MMSAGRFSTAVLTVLLAWCVCCASPSAADEVKVEAVLVGTETLAFSLPKTALHASFLDADVPVALLIAESEDPHFYRVCFAPDRNSPCTYVNYGPSRVREIQALHGPTAKRVNLGLLQPFSENLIERIRGLFPRTRVCRENEVASAGELPVRAELIAEFLEPGNDFYNLNGLKLTARLAIGGADGGGPQVVEGVGLSAAKKSFWSQQPDWQDIARQALPAALDQLVGAIRASQPLRARLHELAQTRALPAGLVTTARFDDSGSLLPNGRLDAGEQARILIKVTNEGPGPAFNVAVRVKPDLPQINVAGEAAVGDLSPGEKREVALAIGGGVELPAAVARLRIETTERRGYGARPVLLELATGELLASKLEIVDVTLNDRTGRAKGDGDGQPANGETIEAVVRVRNGGPGEAASVSVTMAAPLGAAEILEPRVVVPRILVGHVEEARLLFRLPLAVEAKELSLAFRVVEARGARAGAAATEQRWKIRQKRPAVELAYRLYDGNSARSAGNRDGRVNNGERIEVLVTPTNRGELPARGLKIGVASDDPKLVPSPAVLEVGDLPAEAEGPAQRFTFDVPRAYGVGRLDGELHFSLTVTQRDFPTRRELLALAFRALRPDLFLDTSAPPELARGTRGEMVLRLRNGGELRAEDVVVEIASDAPGMDLLDEHGVPVRSRKIVLGALDPQAVAAEPRIGLSVRRSTTLGPATVHLTVTQRDFPPLLRSAPVTVTEEAPAVVVASRGEERSAPKVLSPAPPTPATISFLGNTPGQHLLTEAIVLRFEVQSPGSLAEVRLTQNERLLSLETARRSASATGVLQGVQYELPVRLEEGENRFEVVALTEQGYLNKRSLTLLRDREVGRLWVVAIGISKYQDPAIPRLGYADADARSPFDPRAAGERALISGEFLDRMSHVGKGRVVITASSPDETAQESAALGHGVFTYYLLEGLRGAADLNGDGDIDVHEVYAYLSEKVSRATQGKQNPKLKEPDLVGQILIGHGAVRHHR